MDFIKISPEGVGVPSEAVERFARRLASRDVCLHSFIMKKGGKTFAECYYKPFGANDKHRMYSTSKTFVSMAVGMMIGEGKLGLEDRVADYFPEKLPMRPHRFVTEATVRDLLMMATPFDYNTYNENDRDWVETFFHAKPTHPAGTVFAYNTAATVVLCALVEKLSGKSLLEYMRPALDEIGFSKDAWCVERPEGGAWGGSGVMCTTRDLAAFASLLMRRGNWNGKQLIPEWYVRQATTRQIDNSLDNSTSEESQGYGYQVWITRHGGFATLGMGAQMSICLPELDALLVTTGDTQASSAGMYEVFSAFWGEIYPYLKNPPMHENPFAAASCEAYLSEVCLLPPYVGKRFDGDTSGVEREVSGAVYAMEPNPMRISRISFTFAGEVCFMRYTNATGEHEIELGIGGYRVGTFPETHYYGKRIGTAAGRGYRCASSAVWAGERTIVGRVYIIDDYFGTLRFQATFGNGCVTLSMRKVAEWFLGEYQGIAYGETETVK